MKFNLRIGAVVCLLASVPLAWLLLERRSGHAEAPVVRFATFNVAMNRERAGQLLEELRSGTCEQAKQIAAIVRRLDIDVLLLNELDYDAAGEAAKVFVERYLAGGPDGGAPYEFCYTAPVNTGVPSGLDLDGDGRTDGPGDAFGFGRFPGQYGMALVSRYPILTDRVRTFRELKWSAMPGALRPAGYWSDAVWGQLRLSSKSHWDVPIGIGPVADARVVHVLCSHPTPPVFDGPEDRNGCRNHDEIRFWVDYLTPGAAEWIVDDRGGRGGLPAEAAFVLLGDLNCDPADGDARREGLAALLSHPRVVDVAPRGPGGAEQAIQQWGVNAGQRGAPELDTGDFPDATGEGPGNLRLDYVLLARQLEPGASGVCWPKAHEPLAKAVAASDHRLVFVDVVLR